MYMEVTKEKRIFKFNTFRTKTKKKQKKKKTTIKTQNW